MDMYECNSNSTCKALSFSDVSFKLEGEIISGSDGVRVKLSQARLKHARSWFSFFHLHFEFDFYLFQTYKFLLYKLNIFLFRLILQ